MEKTTAPNPPLATFRDGYLKLSVFENDGQKGKYHSITMSKLYEGDDGQLKETRSFSPGDLLSVAELAREAHRFVRDRRRELSRERDAEPLVEPDAPAVKAEPRRDVRRDDRPERFRDYPALER